MLNHQRSFNFPAGFLWGAGTSAHSVEGETYGNDWWQHEQSGKMRFKSGKSCDHFHRYEEDFGIAQSMHHNVHRLSLEWSRIEPREGEWNIGAIAHYQNVLEAIKNRGMATMVTLWDVALPKWFADKGGFEHARNTHYFARYADFVTKRLGSLIDFTITLSELNEYINRAYHEGDWPPFAKGSHRGMRVFLNLALAHRAAYARIHEVATEGGHLAQVGVAQHLIPRSNYPTEGVLNKLAVWFHTESIHHGFYKLTGHETHDFYGVNFFSRLEVSRIKGSLRLVHRDVRSGDGESMHPKDLFHVLTDLKEYGKPVYITESGIGTTDDTQRQRYMLAHLNEVYHAIKAGVDVRGYIHWSLLDGFEWHKGFTTPYGLVAVDRKSFERKIKPSGELYSDIVKNNGIEHSVLSNL